MLEYDENTTGESRNSAFNQGFAVGVAEGRIIEKFIILKLLTKKFTDNQIRGLEPAEGDNATLLKIFNTPDRTNLLDFYRKYENFSKNRLIKRYIAESEYLPWR